MKLIRKISLVVMGLLFIGFIGLGLSGVRVQTALSRISRSGGVMDYILHNFFLTAVLLIIMGGLVFHLFRKQSRSRKYVRRIAFAAMFVWLAGVGIYFIGFNDGGCRHNALALFMRSSLSSIEMFVSHSDLIEVASKWHHDAVYMTLFSLIHFCAVLCSASLILGVLSIYLDSKWKMRRWCRQGGRFYVFWNQSSEAYALASKLNDGHIVFITSDETLFSQVPHRMSFSHIIGTESSYGMEHIDLGGRMIVTDQENALSNLNRLHLGRVAFLFLSEDEDKNIRDCQEVRSRFNADVNVEVEFYCHASDCMENRLRTEHLIDSSYLSAMELRRNAEAQPVNFVEPGRTESGRPDGTVTSEFNALVVGFGETGRKVFEWLYETSAFLGKDGRRAPCSLTLVDSSMDDIRGTYLAEKPALKDNPALDFRQCSISSEDYWGIVDGLVSRGLNYVVVSLGDDKTNVGAALALYKYVMRKSTVGADGKAVYNGGKFTIYVRVRGNNYDDILKKFDDGVIRFFGNDNDVFSPAIVFAEKYLGMAQTFEKTYNRHCGGQYACETLRWNTVADMVKNTRKQSQNLANACHVSTKIHLLTGGTMSADVLEKLDAMERVEKSEELMGEYVYVDSEGRRLGYESELMTNLAKCEHLRWMAAVEILGYTEDNTDGTSCDDIRMTHNCLVSWEKLGDIYKKTGKEYRQYDYNVVETSIRLYLDNERNNITR